MNPLEQQLLDLGADLDFPATPDLLSAVRGRLEPHPPRRSRLPRLARRRPLAIALAAAVLLAGTAAAVPPLRHAVERVLGFDGVAIKRVPQLPPLPKDAGAALHLGHRIPIADAAHAASFRALLPPHGVNAAYVASTPAGGRITLVVGRSLLMEFRGQNEPFIEKLLGPGTRLRRLRVDGGRGIYLDRAPHEVLFDNTHGLGETDRIRLEGSVLIWQHGPLILRIERPGSLSRALALARSLR